jgi:hypothetical protein
MPLPPLFLTVNFFALIPGAQTVNLSLWNENFTAGEGLMIIYFALHGPPPDGALMPPQYNRRLFDGKISFDNLTPGFKGRSPDH